MKKQGSTELSGDLTFKLYDTYGFPSKVKDDPIFNLFNEENNAYAEERRLFYVALTRTKNRVYIVVPKSKPSPFVIELKNNINVEFKDDFH